MGLVRKATARELVDWAQQRKIPPEVWDNLPPGVLADLPADLLAQLPDAARSRAGRDLSEAPAPRTHLPKHFLPMAGSGPEEAYDLISSDLLLDGSARLNLATFVTTS
ncbi:MAG TPA: hypothetical protein VGL49_01050, partial [Acidimicrobiales bacterium]